MDRLEIRSRFLKKVERLHLDDFDMDLYVRPLNALSRSKLGEAFLALKNLDADPNLQPLALKAQAQVVAQGLVDEAGTRIYKDDETDAICEEFPATALDQVMKRILEISGLGGSVESLPKNSLPTPSADSPSA